MGVAVLCATAGCSIGKAEPSGPLGLTPEDVGREASDDDLMNYGQEQIDADDPRNRIRSALQKLGQEDKIPENASPEELQALLEEKVEKGLIPREHAEKLLKVMESAHAHNARLERMDQELFGDTAR